MGEIAWGRWCGRRSLFRREWMRVASDCQCCGRVGLRGLDDLLQSLNSLLEAERASVEALVDLTRMSADLLERDMLQRIGGDAAWACSSLRGQIESLGGTPSRRISPALARARECHHFAERLLLLAEHQRAVLGRLEALLEGTLPDDVRWLLAELQRVHLPTVSWFEQRAAAFGPRQEEPGGNVSGAGARRETTQRGGPPRAERERRRGSGGRPDQARRARAPGNEND